jgi:hypothetical protein
MSKNGIRPFQINAPFNYTLYVQTHPLILSNDILCRSPNTEQEETLLRSYIRLIKVTEFKYNLYSNFKISATSTYMWTPILRQHWQVFSPALRHI